MARVWSPRLGRFIDDGTEYSGNIYKAEPVNASNPQNPIDYIRQAAESGGFEPRYTEYVPPAQQPVISTLYGGPQPARVPDISRFTQPVQAPALRSSPIPTYRGYPSEVSAMNARSADGQRQLTSVQPANVQPSTITYAPPKALQAEDQSFNTLAEARAALDAAGGRGGIRQVTDNGPYRIIVSRGADRYNPVLPKSMEQRRVDIPGSGVPDPTAAYRRAGPAIERLASQMGNQGTRKADTSEDATMARLGIDRKTFRGMSPNARADAILRTKEIEFQANQGASKIAASVWQDAQKQGNDNYQKELDRLHQTNLKIFDAKNAWDMARQSSMDAKELEKVKSENDKALQTMRQNFDVSQKTYETEAKAKIEAANLAFREKRWNEGMRLDVIKSLMLLAKDISQLDNKSKVEYLKTLGVPTDEGGIAILRSMQAVIDKKDK